MEILPLAPKVTANGAANKTTVSRAQVVYVCATADDLITNDTTGATIQVHENQSLVLHKDSHDHIFAGTTTTHFTKIAFPRG